MENTITGRTVIVEKEWTERIKEAFAELRTKNFIALQNHLCCSSCAWSDISGRVTSTGRFKAGTQKAGQKCEGIVFYHKQDTERILNGKGYLAFGTAKDSDTFKNDKELNAEAKAIGEVICEVLRKHKIIVVWNGNPDERILIINPLDYV